MKNLNENDFIMIGDGVAVCIKDSKYKGFNIETGMVIVDKSLATESFEMISGTILDAESDIVVTQKDGDIFIGYVKIYKNFNRFTFRVKPGYKKLRIHLIWLRKQSKNDEVESAFKEILSWKK